MWGSRDGGRVWDRAVHGARHVAAARHASGRFAKVRRSMRAAHRFHAGAYHRPRGWFARHAGRTGALMFPLGAAGFAAALATCLVTRTASAVLAAIASAGVVGVTVLVNEPANRRFAGPVYLSDADTVALLGRWRRWHWLRVGLGLLAFVAAVVAGG